MNEVKGLQCWLKNHRRFIIVGITILVLLIGVMFGLTFSLSRLLGNVYDVDSIGNNIDKIKIGDTINYTANGYSDWKVHSINKENNTIEIVSKTSVEDLMVKVEEVNKLSEIFQSTANKYLDGKNAISARIVGEADLDNLEVDEGYWINKIEEGNLYYSSGRIGYSGNETSNADFFFGYLMPVVTINVGDTSSLNVGDAYTFSLNGKEEWVVLYVDDSTNISVVPKEPIAFEFLYNNVSNFSSFVETEVGKFKSDNIVSVRSVSVDDSYALYNIRNKINYVDYSEIYTNEVEESPYEWKVDKSKFVRMMVEYDIGCLSTNVNWSSYNSYTIHKGWKGGVVPVVTLKYSKEPAKGSDVNENLNIGDYVKYSANGYSNWKVLDIDNENNTVDIVSANIVKNITLDGREGYENLENILQEEVDKYKIGDSAIGARALEIDDLDKLKLIKDSIQAKFFLNNKMEYRLNDDFKSVFSYSCAVGTYDVSIAGIKYEWAVLADKSLYSSDIMTEEPNKYYQYTAGLRPVITLKMSDVQEGTAGVDSSNKWIDEQFEANMEAHDMVTEEELSDAEVIDDNETNVSDLKKQVSKHTYILNNLEESLSEMKKSNDLLMILIFVLTGVCGFTLFYCIKKRK